MQAIEKILDFLKQYPFVRYERREDAIRAFPSSEKGFEVALLVTPESYVCYALWHTEFADEQMAVNAFQNGFSDAVRLRVTSQGGVDYRWRIEFREAGGWISSSAVGIFRYPFWKKKITRYLQNDYFISNANIRNFCGDGGYCANED